MEHNQPLLTLCDAFSAHMQISHWAISMRILRKGDFFAGLKAGGGCTIRTDARVRQWFSDNWPTDLAWPRDVPRPPKQKKDAA